MKDQYQKELLSVMERVLFKEKKEIEEISHPKRLPYIVERNILKEIRSFLNENGEFVTENGKILDIKDEEFIWKMEGKVSRMNDTELNLFFEKLQEDGPEWGCNYLFGGKRRHNHLCLMEYKYDPDENFNSDKFLSFNGRSTF